MNLIPWRKKQVTPLGRETGLSTPLAEFRSEMDRLFDRFFHHGSTLAAPGWTDESSWPGREFMPSVDVAESDKQITIRAEVPGLDPKDIDINISGNILTIHGEKKESSEEQRDDYYHCERRFGSFTRCVELPSTADVDHIDAEQRNGVLSITVKKLPTARTKKIDVKATRPKLERVP